MNYSPFRHITSAVWKRRPVQLTFFVTRRCNARCPFCFYLSRPENREPSQELSLDEIMRVSSSLGSLLWLAFSGGEPFLRDDFVEIARTFYRNNRPSIILLPTNGLQPEVISERTAEILRACPKSTVTVKLSLDGPEDINDHLRGVPGAFRKTLETYERLRPLAARHRNFELGINSVFCSANQGRMDELILFIQDLKGRPAHTVSLVRGTIADKGLKNIDIGAYERTIGKLEKDLHENGGGRYRFSGARLKAAQDIVQRRLIRDTAAQDKRLIPCTAGRLTLVLTETGDLYPCESFEGRMGNVREWEYNVKKLLSGSDAQAVLQAVMKSGCHCTHECYMMMNLLFTPARYPELLREYLRLGPARPLRAGRTGPAAATAKAGS